MAEQRLHSLLDALEGRARSLLERLALEREARRHAETVQGELAQRLAELERRLAEAEATRLELAEECRELDEQNNELEAHNRHLHERLVGGEPAEGGFRPGRRSQGLSALIGRRPTPAVEQPSAAPATAEGAADGSSTTAASSGSPGVAPVRSDQAAEPDAGSQAASPAKEARLIGDQATSADPEASPAPPSAHQDSLTIGEAPSPQVLLEEWYARYPAAFFKGHTRPLMVGIHEVLASREPWPEKLVRRALACYVNLPRYLKAVRVDAERIDLDGQPAGKVDAQSADHAHRKLDRLQGEKRPRQGRNGRPHQGPGSKQDPRRKGRGQPAGASPAAEQSAKGKPNEGAKGKPSPRGQGGSAGQGPRPAPERGEPAPATMEEKLSALLAKHNGR